MPSLTLDQWEFDLGAAVAGSDGWTVAEIAKRRGLSIERTRGLLRQAVDAGLWHCSGRRPVKSLDGRTVPVPVYAPVKPQPKGKAK